MSIDNAHHLSETYTALSDRFRSLWTFYQFLGGVFKHQDLGQLPFEYDFQGLYRRLQALMPRMDMDGDGEVAAGLDGIDSELDRLHERLAEAEARFPPSVLRPFFDHLKRQDEKILVALAKFYLRLPELDEDALDKLDILLTRLAEAPLEDGSVLHRDSAEIRAVFSRLGQFAGVPELEEAEQSTLAGAVRELRGEFESASDFGTLLTSKVYDRFRRFKHRLGRSMLSPAILTEVVATNIAAKNRFQELFHQEEVQILEDTNRIFEIERYLERNPDLAHEDLRNHITAFRHYRSRLDSGRKEENVKREDLLELRRAMNLILQRFDGEDMPAAPEPPRAPPAPRATIVRSDEPFVQPTVDEVPPPELLDLLTEDPAETEDPGEAGEAEEIGEGATSLAELLPPDPLLSESLHKIMFALELASWNRSPEQGVNGSGLHNLRLEPWEADAYRELSDHSLRTGSPRWELLSFFLTSAALRLKMEEEAREIVRLGEAGDPDLLSKIHAERLRRWSRSTALASASFTLTPPCG